MNILLFKSFIKNRILLHVLFWVSYFSISLLGWISDDINLGKILWGQTIVVFLVMLLIYFTNYILYGYFIKKLKWYWLAPFMAVGIVLFFSQAQSEVYNYFLDELGYHTTFKNYLAFQSFLFFFGLSFKISRELYLSLIREIEEKEELIKIKDHALTSQI